MSAISRRIHKNDFEHLVTVLPLSMVNGLVFPRVTMGHLAVYFMGRNLFTNGYQEKEGAFNSMRIAGSITVNMVHFLTMGTSMFLAYRLIGGKLCIQKALAVILPK